MCSIVLRDLIRPSSMAIGSSLATGKFDSLEILNEIPVPVDHTRGFLLSRFVQSRQQRCPNSGCQRRL
jgi:hypothetical protein